MRPGGFRPEVVQELEALLQVMRMIVAGSGGGGCDLGARRPISFRLRSTGETLDHHKNSGHSMPGHTGEI